MAIMSATQSRLKMALKDETTKNYAPERLMSLINRSIREDVRDTVDDVLENPQSPIGRMQQKNQVKLDKISYQVKRVKDDTTYIRKKIDELVKITKDRSSPFDFLKALGGAGKALSGLAATKLLKDLLRSPRKYSNDKNDRDPPKGGGGVRPRIDMPVPNARPQRGRANAVAGPTPGEIRAYMLGRSQAVAGPTAKEYRAYTKGRSNAVAGPSAKEIREFQRQQRAIASAGSRRVTNRVDATIANYVTSKGMDYSEAARQLDMQKRMHDVRMRGAEIGIRMKPLPKNYDLMIKYPPVIGSRSQTNTPAPMYPDLNKRITEANARGGRSNAMSGPSQKEMENYYLSQLSGVLPRATILQMVKSNMMNPNKRVPVNQSQIYPRVPANEPPYLTDVRNRVARVKERGAITAINRSRILSPNYLTQYPPVFNQMTGTNTPSPMYPPSPVPEMSYGPQNGRGGLSGAFYNQQAENALQERYGAIYGGYEGMYGRQGIPLSVPTFDTMQGRGDASGLINFRRSRSYQSQPTFKRGGVSGAHARMQAELAQLAYRKAAAGSRRTTALDAKIANLVTSTMDFSVVENSIQPRASASFARSSYLVDRPSPSFSRASPLVGTSKTFARGSFPTNRPTGSRSAAVLDMPSASFKRGGLTGAYQLNQYKDQFMMNNMDFSTIPSPENKYEATTENIQKWIQAYSHGFSKTVQQVLIQGADNIRKNAANSKVDLGSIFHGVDVGQMTAGVAFAVLAVMAGTVYLDKTPQLQQVVASAMKQAPDFMKGIMQNSYARNAGQGYRPATQGSGYRTASKFVTNLKKLEASNPKLARIVGSAKIMKYLKIGGTALVVAGASVDPLMAWAYGKTDQEVRKEIVGAIGEITGSLSLAALSGSAVGITTANPIAAIIAALVGGVIGAYAGESVSEWMFDFIMKVDENAQMQYDVIDSPLPWHGKVVKSVATAGVLTFTTVKLLVTNPKQIGFNTAKYTKDEALKKLEWLLTTVETAQNQRMDAKRAAEAGKAIGGMLKKKNWKPSPAPAIPRPGTRYKNMDYPWDNPALMMNPNGNNPGQSASMNPFGNKPYEVASIGDWVGPPTGPTRQPDVVPTPSMRVKAPNTFAIDNFQSGWMEGRLYNGRPNAFGSYLSPQGDPVSSGTGGVSYSTSSYKYQKGGMYGGAPVTNSKKNMIANHPLIDDPAMHGGMVGYSTQYIKTGEYKGSNSKQKAIIKQAKRLGIPPEDLTAIISYESAGTMSPSKWGGKGGNYLGLIQFGPNERKKYGVHAGQTFEEQMEAVGSFLEDRGFKRWVAAHPDASVMDVRTALYSTINAGSPGEKYWSRSDNGGRDTVRTHAERIFSANAGHTSKAASFLKGMERVGGVGATITTRPGELNISGVDSMRILANAAVGENPAGNAIDMALKMQGVHEVTDRRMIMDYLKTGGQNLDPSQTAWCAAFVNSTLQQQGIKGTGSFVATSFSEWGNRVNPADVIKGDVLVQHRGRRAGATGGHVGMATGRTKMVNGEMFIEMVGGNQASSTSGGRGVTVNTKWVAAKKLHIQRADEQVSFLRNQRKSLGLETDSMTNAAMLAQIEKKREEMEAAEALKEKREAEAEEAKKQAENQKKDTAPATPHYQTALSDMLEPKTTGSPISIIESNSKNKNQSYERFLMDKDKTVSSLSQLNAMSKNQDASLVMDHNDGIINMPTSMT